MQQRQEDVQGADNTCYPQATSEGPKRAPGVNCPCDNYLAIKDSHKSIITDFEACYKIIKQGKHLLIVSVH